MSTKAGFKNYSIYVTDTSGSPISGATSGWLITGRVNTDVITTGTVQEISDGFYFATIDVPNGTGFVKISNTNTSYIITPSYFVIDDNIHDTDDLYDQQQIVSTNVDVIKSIVSGLRIGSQEAASCYCLGPPAASQPPLITERLSPIIYPNIFNFSL